MFGQIVGYVYLKKKITTSVFLWGDLSEIEGTVLHVLECNPRGDCLCFHRKGIVDVNVEDIEKYVGKVIK